jgi:hypothetical protein
MQSIPISFMERPHIMSRTKGEKTDPKPEWMKRATVPVTEAGKILGISRNLAYEAARLGQLPVLEFGRRKVVATSVLKKMLGLQEGA